MLSFARLTVPSAGKQLQLEEDKTKIRFKRQMAFKGINAGIPNAKMVTGRKERAGKRTHRGPGTSPLRVSLSADGKNILVGLSQMGNSPSRQTSR